MAGTASGLAADHVQRRHLTRARLLAAAKGLFGKNGYHRTQVMDIVTQARVSAGTFYKHFDDKQGIFSAIAEELSCHEIEEAERARSMILEAPDFPTAVRSMARHLERHFEHVVERASLYQALASSGLVDSRRDHALAMREKVIAALVEQLARSGPKDTGDLDSLARMIIGVISEMRSSMVRTGKPAPAQAARLVTRFLQGALAAYTTTAPRYPELFSDAWRETLEAEAPV
jgi:AcrR family transcriptional regulator